MKKILLTGGGTGGHVYPNLALVPYLKKEYDVVYVGGEGDTLEKRLSETAGINYYSVPNVKLVRSLSPKAIVNNLTIPTVLARSIAKSKKLLLDLEPSLVFSKGGYVALPVVISARKLGIPVICHESDLTLGLSNKIGKLLGAKILTANPKSEEGKYVGMPLRDELFDGKDLRKSLRIKDDVPVLLVTGGSSGAKALNDFVFSHLDKLTKEYFVLHLTGKGYSPPTHKNYLPIGYSDDMPSLYRTADVVVSRAGATALFELSALSKKTVFVPLPKSASRGDQLLNADLALEYGGFVVLQEDIEILPDAIATAFVSPPMQSLATDTNGKILREIRDSIRRGELCSNKKR